MFRTIAIALLPLLVKLVVAVPTTTTRTSLNDRSKFLVLADGSSYQSGDITPNLRWQASGLLSVGCSESIGINVKSDLFTLRSVIFAPDYRRGDYVGLLYDVIERFRGPRIETTSSTTV